MTVSSQLQKVRKAKRMTQAQFADYLGVSSRTYTNYETEKRSPPIEIIVKISEQDHYRIEWLITGTGYEKSWDAGANVKKTVKLVEEFINLNDLTPTLDQKECVTSVIFEAISEQPNLSKHLIQSMMQSILVNGEA